MGLKILLVIYLHEYLNSRHMLDYPRARALSIFTHIKYIIGIRLNFINTYPIGMYVAPLLVSMLEVEGR